MAIRKIITVKDPLLREKSRPVEKVDKKLLQLVKDLEDTLLAQKDPEGVGLAAPQIGVNLRAFVMRHRGKIIPVINPEILSVSEKTNDPENKETEKQKNQETKNDYVMEGCLSLPHYYGPVQRAWEVTLKYQIPKMENARPASLGEAGGKWKMENTTKSFKGFPAQIIQHEIDHLDGKIFVDRLLEQKRKLYEMKGKEWEEVEI